MKDLRKFIATTIKEFLTENVYFDELKNNAINYSTELIPDKLPNKKGHYIDNLPKNTQKILVDSSLFEKEPVAWGKVSKNKIAYHDRPTDDKYWIKNIHKEPVILVDYYEENDELRVIDGNHRLTIYLNNGVKKIPTVLTKKAMNYLVNLK
jgi:hypothetical protein